MTEMTAVAIDVGSRIQSIRGLQVLLDSDLAAIYGVSTKAFNQAVKRGAERFPKDFAFQLSEEEFARLRSQIVTSKPGRGGRRYLPWACTEHGAGIRTVAATILNSPRAVEMSVFVVRAFVHLRDFARTHAELGRQLAKLERRVVAHDGDVKQVFAALRRLLEPPKSSRPPIGFKPAKEP